MTPPFTLQAFDGPGERAMVRECSRCPAYVVRCAHLAGDPRVVWFTDRDGWLSAPPNHEHSWYDGRFHVLLGELEFTREAPDCTCAVMVSVSRLTDTNDRAEADAAFAKYEARLLGRQEEDWTWTT